MFAIHLKHAKDALLEGFDLAVEFATLGEYMRFQSRGARRRFDVMCPHEAGNTEGVVVRRSDVHCEQTLVESHSDRD